MSDAQWAGLHFRPRPAGAKGGRPRTSRDRAQTFIRIALSTGPVSAHQLFEMGALRGISAKTMRRAAKEVGVIKEPPGGGWNCSWRLP